MAVAGSSTLAAVPSHRHCLQRRVARGVFTRFQIRESATSWGAATGINCHSRRISSSSSSLSGASSRHSSSLGQPKCCCKPTMYDNPAIYSNDDAVRAESCSTRLNSEGTSSRHVVRKINHAIKALVQCQSTIHTSLISKQGVSGFGMHLLPPSHSSQSACTGTSATSKTQPPLSGTAATTPSNPS